MINSVGIHVKVRDFNKSYRFYRNLGFKPIFECGPEKKVVEDYNGAVFEHSGTRLEIADGHRAVKPEVFKESITSSKISLMIGVDRLTDVIRLCSKHKIKIEVGVRHYYWETLELVVKDPDGLVLVFITPYSENEAKKLKADESFSKKNI